MSDAPAFDILDGPHPDAETVLLSAGLGGTAGYWAPQLDALRTRYRVVTYDQAGTGRARRPLPADHSIAAMADEACAVLDASRTPAAHFVGHALGGLVGLALATRAPERLLSLCVVNGWAKAAAHTRRCFDMRLALLRHEGPSAYVRAQPIFLFPADWLERNADRAAHEEAHGLAGFQGAETLQARIAALLAFDAGPDLARLSLPTLIVASRDDVLVPSAMSEALAASIPGARLELFPWGGHAINVTQPDPFNTLLLECLGST
ncbi:pyrimidine utilization protein D [Reyranella sp.]|uniref:pyrimidine utilization protein D n=1 Tax=Reyranella sp. TaxID=1929291 RepID=UPI003BA90F22